MSLSSPVKKFGARYILPHNSETTAQPGSRGRVLRNLREITSKREMDLLEYRALVNAQQELLTKIDGTTRFTTSLLLRMHKTWLGEIYEWSGKYRTVELSKGSFGWPPAAMIPSNMDMLQNGLLRDYTPCMPSSLTQTARQIAEIHAELLFIHPFREGNGRLARWLADLMALQAGLPAPALTFYGKGSMKFRARYLESVTRGYIRDYEPLTSLFREAIELRLREED